MEGRGRIVKNNGYVKIYLPEHPRSCPTGYVYEHILIAEKTLGKPLPPGVEVHHVNEIPGDNQTPGNFVICESDAYHKLLHQRKRALKACGHASWLKCKYCGRYDKPENIYKYKGEQGYHRSCKAERDAVWYAAKKARLCAGSSV
jgi:hypothetical protein